MTMKFVRYCMLTLMAAVTLTGCNEDEFASSVKEGLPARVTLRVEVPTAQKVAMTRAGYSDFEYAVKDLVLVMFNQSGHREILYVDINKMTLKETDTENGGAVYEYTENLSSVDQLDDPAHEILSGNYDVYAIANYNAGNSNCEYIDPLDFETKEQVEAAMAEWSENIISVTGSKGLPMTDYQQCEVAPGETTEIALSLRRNTAKVEFTFVNGSHTTDGQTVAAHFTPTHYTVYNLPKSAYLIDRRDNGKEALSGRGVINEANKLDGVEYFNTERIAITGESGLSFFMLENNQVAKNTCADYSARDKWNGTNADGTKIFLNAPEEGTYVVVEGTYADNDYNGNVSYTIHLGDFSQGSGQKGFDNFKVNRNEHQTYRVTVNGVNSIVTEAQHVQADGGNNPGVEGEVAKSENNFVLDSHYEAVMLSFSEAAWTSFKDKTEHLVRVKTPETDFVAKDYIFTKQADGSFKASDASGDFGWLQFEKPASATSFPVYNNGNKGDGKGNAGYANYRKSHSIAAFFANPDGFALHTDGKYYVTVFVDEYYYGEETEDRPGKAALPLKKWVNTVNRVFMCDYANVVPSQDGNSNYIKDYLFSVNQRSIKTVYDLEDESLNPFGIETWNEAPAQSMSNTSVSNTTRMNGWQNTVLSVYGSSTAADPTPNGAFSVAAGNTKEGIRPTTSGYVNPVSDNNKASHKYAAAGGAASTTIFGACLSHNRDKNGNSRIDKSELKWYLPALDQYLITWLGINELNEDTRLFEEGDFSKVVLGDDNKPQLGSSGDWVHHMVTSTSGSRSWWQEQAVSSGNVGVNWEDNSYEFRAARTLRKTNEECSKPFEVYTKGSGTNTKYIVKVNGISAKRNNVVTGLLPSHTMTDKNNYLPMAFEVATVASVKSRATRVQLSNRQTTKLDNDVKSFWQDNSSEQGTWRVINQRELMIVSMISAYTDALFTTNSGIGTSAQVFCCTLHPSPIYKYPFVLQKTKMQLWDGGNGGGSSSGRYIPVRDYTGNYAGYTKQ